MGKNTRHPPRIVGLNRVMLDEYPEKAIREALVIEQQMNIRQKAIVTRALVNGTVTSGWCRKQLPVAYDTIRRDLLELVKLGVIEQKGKGRSTRYVTRNEPS